MIAHQNNRDYTKTFKYIGDTPAHIPADIDVKIAEINNGVLANLPHPDTATNVVVEGDREARKKDHEELEK